MKRFYTWLFLLCSAAVLLAVGVLSGCTTMILENPDGSRFITRGAWMLSREDAFVLTLTNRDAATTETINLDREYYLERQTDENANGQIKMMEKAFELGQRAALPVP